MTSFNFQNYTSSIISFFNCISPGILLVRFFYFIRPSTSGKSFLSDFFHSCLHYAFGYSFITIIVTLANYLAFSIMYDFISFTMFSFFLKIIYTILLRILHLPSSFTIPYIFLFTILSNIFKLLSFTFNTIQISTP